MGFGVIGIQKCKKKYVEFFFCVFELPLLIYEFLSSTNVFLLISYLEQFQPVKY